MSSGAGRRVRRAERRFCAGRDINLDILRVEGYRKFCNKIWNATRFAMLKLDAAFVPAPPKVCAGAPVCASGADGSASQPAGRESLVERWILHKLNAAAAEVNRQLADRNFMLATSAAYNFWLYELCDVYIVRPVLSPITARPTPTDAALHRKP